MEILRLLLTSVAYFIAAKVALFYTIPPGYAAMIWPASGIALGFLLKFGYRQCIGVFLGSFAANLTNSASIGFFDFGLVDFLLPFVIACGAALQAVIGRYLIKRFIHENFALIEMLQIIKFIFLVGTIGTLISPTVGVTALLVAGSLAIDDLFVNWMNWWVGDSLGIILITPLVYLIFGQPSDSWGARRVSVGLPLITALILTAISVQLIKNQDNAKNKDEFGLKARVAVSSMEKQWATNIENLYAIRSLIEVNLASQSNAGLNANNFKGFVEHNMGRLSGVKALSWNPVIKHEDRESTEMSMRSEGFVDFSFTERDENGNLKVADEREKYVIVQYIEPFADNLAAHGFDVYSNKERQIAMDAARDWAEPVATAAITLVQENSIAKGVLAFLPVYIQRTPATSAEIRNQQLLGYAVGVFRVGDVLAAAVNLIGLSNAVILLMDATDETNPISLSGYEIGDDGTGAELQLSGLDYARNEYTYIEDINIGTRNWRLEISPTSAYFSNQRTWTAWGTPLAHFSVIVLFAFFILSITGRTILESDQRIALKNMNLALERQIQLRKAAEIKLAKLAESDGLTGLANRRAFDERLAELVEKSQERGTPFSLLILDIDFFKKINDTFGHAAGDEVLKKFSQLLRETVRSSDLVARIGGEEFAVLLNNSFGLVSKTVANEIRLRTERLHLNWEESPFSITVSIGVSDFPEGASTTRELLEKADNALYQAKRSGRNKVCLAK